MSNDDTLRRRSFLQATGAAAVAVTLAGCMGDDNGDDDEDDDNGDDDYDYLDDEPDYGDWLDGVDYGGTVDWTGEDQVEVAVGADDGYRFEPPSIAISPGTEVVWEWTGMGGAHDVTEEDEVFASDLVDEEGHTFEHTFDDEGTYRYVCTPHDNMDMFGVVHVE